MKKYIKKISYLLIIVIFISLVIAINNLSNNIKNKKDQISFLRKNLENKTNQIENIHNNLLKKNINVENVIFEDGINFKKNDTKKINVENNNYVLKQLISNDLIFAKHPEASSSAYIDYYEEKIFLVTATGQITFTNISNIKKDEIKFNSVKSNIQKIIKYSDFYSNSAFGIKDILLHDKKIYLSFIKEHSIGCYSTSILVGEFNPSYINFKPFYVPPKCVDKKNKFFDHPKDKLVAHQSGGRMLIIGDELYFSTGEYRHRTLAQENNSDFGKILSFNLKNQTKKIISKGHRNPQGLFYSKNLNALFSTEHGPSGGDEINFLDFKKYTENNSANFGWPMASYGRHYFDNDDDSDTRYILSPLKKSHKENGYIEPIKYFTPSVGISQIIGVPNEFYKSTQNSFIVGTMGHAQKINDGMLSLYFFEFSDNKINKEKLVPINSRVRDLTYLHDHNIVLMFLENYNSLGILALE